MVTNDMALSILEKFKVRESLIPMHGIGQKKVVDGRVMHVFSKAKKHFDNVDNDETNFPEIKELMNILNVDNSTEIKEKFLEAFKPSKNK